jgi:hypothetical protein
MSVIVREILEHTKDCMLVSNLCRFLKCAGHTNHAFYSRHSYKVSYSLVRMLDRNSLWSLLVLCTGKSKSALGSVLLNHFMYALDTALCAFVGDEASRSRCILLEPVD